MASLPQLRADPLTEVLAARTRPGSLYRTLPGGGALECFACGHRCVLKDGRVGICKVRFNAEGVLRVPWGYVGALQVDPVEKKPFFHALPGSDALSFGMLGCDYHCGYCQNWITSQALRDPVAGAPPRDVTPQELVRLAAERGARIVTSTYNEPLITTEWAIDVFREARAAGLLTSYVSNGNGTPEVLDALTPHLDLYKVDLKGFDDRAYRTLGGVLEPVLATIEGLHRRGIWVEVVTLLVPGFNDSEREVRAMAHFLAGISRDIPWHVTAFHADYKMQGRGDTTAATLVRSVAIGKEAGLRFVYAGNRPGQVGTLEDTLCPGCGLALVERTGFHVRAMRIEDGACPRCARPIPGRWSRDGNDVARADVLARAAAGAAAVR